MPCRGNASRPLTSDRRGKLLLPGSTTTRGRGTQRPALGLDEGQRTSEHSRMRGDYLGSHNAIPTQASAGLAVQTPPSDPGHQQPSRPPAKHEAPRPPAESATSFQVDAGFSGPRLKVPTYRTTGAQHINT